MSGSLHFFNYLTEEVQFLGWSKLDNFRQKSLEEQLAPSELDELRQRHGYRHGSAVNGERYGKLLFQAVTAKRAKVYKRNKSKDAYFNYGGKQKAFTLSKDADQNHRTKRCKSSKNESVKKHCNGDSRSSSSSNNSRTSQPLKVNVEKSELLNEGNGSSKGFHKTNDRTKIKKSRSGDHQSPSTSDTSKVRVNDEEKKSMQSSEENTQISRHKSLDRKRYPGSCSKGNKSKEKLHKSSKSNCESQKSVRGKRKGCRSSTGRTNSAEKNKGTDISLPSTSLPSTSQSVSEEEDFEASDSSRNGGQSAWIDGSCLVLDRFQFPAVSYEQLVETVASMQKNKDTEDFKRMEAFFEKSNCHSLDEWSDED